MKNKILVAILGLLSLNLFSSTVFAELPPMVRENFSSWVKKQCFNTINYQVSDSVGLDFSAKNNGKCVGGKCAEYHKLLNCLLDDALEKKLAQTNQEIITYANQKKFAEFREQKIYDNQYCRDLQLEFISQQQTDAGFVSSCTEPENQSEYSACKLTETFLNEFCGYKNFLKAKELDYKSFKAEEEILATGRNSTLNSWNTVRQKYNAESAKAEKALLESVIFYKDYSHKIATNQWLVAIKLNLKNAGEEFARVVRNILLIGQKVIDKSSF